MKISYILKFKLYILNFKKRNIMFRVKTIEDLELVYSILREQNPNNQIDITFNWNTKEYTLKVSNKIYKNDPEVPLDLDIEVIYGDTDSIFLKFKFNREDFEQNRIDTFNLATIAGEKLTNEVFNRPPIEMEFEKVFQPFVLLTKKRYIGKKFENPKDPFQLKTIDSKGIALTRRDYCKLVKDCYKSIIDVIMSKTSGDTDDTLLRSIEVFKNYCNKIHEYDVQEDDLCISAMLAKEYSCGVCKKKTEWSGIRCECKYMNSHLVDHCGKCKSSFTCKHVFSLAHVNLAVNLLKRREDVQVNDRIQYIFVEGKDPKQKKGELAEDITWAKRLGLKFNRLCYLEQLAKPILGLYKVLLQNNESELDKLIEWVNNRIENYGGKRLKPSDFKIDE